MMATIATWNHGYNTVGSRHIDEAWHLLLDELEVDVALVQETVIPDWVRESCGVSFLKVWRSRVWGSAVVTRSRRHDILLADPNLRVLVIRADVPVLGRATLASLHARIINQRVIPQLRRLITALLPSLDRQLFIVGGDLNTARGAHAMWPRNGHGDFWDWVGGLGWHDCLWETFGVEQPTLWSPGCRPLQTDHLFLDSVSGGMVRGVEVLGQDRVGGLSDHAVIMIRVEAA
jgi:hypothetical protein